MIKESLVSLTALEKHQYANIAAIITKHRITKRLADLGLTPNTIVKVIRKTLFSGTIEINLRGSNLILGKGVAAKILVTKLWKNQE